MMSRSKRIFRLIRDALPGLELCNDMLVVSPTEHIIRGFLIETTTEKGRVYLWRVVTPLYRPMNSVFLDYSDRIPPNEDVYIDSSAYQSSAARIQAVVVESLEYLRSVRTPRDFMQHVHRMIGNRSINFRFDLALTYYLIGNVRQCRDILRAIDVEVDQLDPKSRMPVDQAIKRAASEIQSNPASFQHLLEEWEAANIDRLGLRPSWLVSTESN
jgi:hypothetical protein